MSGSGASLPLTLQEMGGPSQPRATPGWVGPASATLLWSDVGSACGQPSGGGGLARPEQLPRPPQHYTSDADGLCTRLIKPKVMEGTVAAQDEFFRSEWRLHPQSSLACPPPPTLTSWHCPHPRESRDPQGLAHPV